jgi:hypothetical protein
VDANTTPQLVFSRCADSVEQGRRLENLSWRLWNRETFCCETGELKQAPATTSLTTTLPKDISQENTRNLEPPQLSGSVESIEEEQVIEFTSVSAPLEIVRPRIRRQDSCASSRSRGKERHITSDDFEKMVEKIFSKEPLDAPLPEISSPYLVPQKEMLELTPQFERSGSTTTESPAKSDEPEQSSQLPSSPEITSRTTVVRGFTPSPVAYPRSVLQQPRAPSPAAIPEPSDEPAPRPVQSKKQQKFHIGHSSSSSEQDPSINTSKFVVPKKTLQQFNRSALEESSPKSALHSSRSGSLITAQKKQTSFSDHVTTRTIHEAAIDDQSETEAEYMDESAIDDDDDSSDWEDSIEDSGKSSIDEKTFFQRVDSKANLTSRRSLITLMIEQTNNPGRRLANAASQSTSALHRPQHNTRGPSFAVSPNDSDDNPLMMKKGVRATPLKPINEVPRSSAQPIMATTSHPHHQAALSPRTTRRNMLATELTESLRRHLLWERQQKSSTANAVLKRRHTSHDVANLKQYPEKAYMNKNEDVNASSWNQYFTKEAFNGYHSKGW